ncbi:SulP family inorganic anion transporter [Paracoccus jiaweipingae]|uniref:SulP family inorganic anion transporter n=1 Tax=unclassified Paracoccus (in: a-proteobacteria) TaxID=2688777 RepID=UPI00379C2F96
MPALPARWRADLLAGLTLAAVAIPEQLATARLTGLAPATGLLAFVAAALAMRLVSRQPWLSVGADSTIAPVLAAALILPGDAHVVALMVGLVLVSVRLLRLGWLATLISAPVTCGALLAIALHILIGRLPGLLGLTLPEASGLAALLAGVWQDRANALPAPAVLGLAVTVGCLLAEYLRPRAPVVLLVLLTAIALAALIDPQGHQIARLDPAAAQAAPGLPGWPALADLVRLLPVALIVGFLCMTQTQLVLDSLTPDAPPDTSQRQQAILSVGLANLAAGLAGAFPVNASPPRSQIARRAGAVSPWAGVVAAALALGLLLVPAPLALIPVPALAGLLIFIALRLIPARRIRDIARRSPAELPLVAASAGLVLFLPIETGIALAMLLSVLHALSVALRIGSGPMARYRGTSVWGQPGPHSRAETVPGVLVFALGAPVSFVTAPRMVAAVDAALAALPAPPRLLVLEAAGVISVDITGAGILSAAIGRWRQRGLVLRLARLESPRARHEARRTGLLDALAPEPLFLSVAAALEAPLPGHVHNCADQDQTRQSVTLP